MWPTFLDPFQLRILMQIVVSMVLGAFIGLEREMADRPAGLRTHMLVAGAATLFVALGHSVIQYFNQDLGTSLLRSDPIRIVEAVITGISFLGAGTIIRSTQGGDVQGLTTAASILMAAAMGVAIAVNLWLLAVGVTLLTLIILRVLPWIERVIRSNSSQNSHGADRD